MTTASGKKTPKTGKAPARRGQRKKVIEKAPTPVEIDKQKMAAFFSAAGLEETPAKPGEKLVKAPVKVKEAAAFKEPVNETVEEPVKEPVKVKEPIKVEETKKVVSKKSVVQPPAKPIPTPVAESIPVEEAPPAAKKPEKIEAVAAAAPAVMIVTESKDSDSKKGETPMTTTAPATSGGSNSGSFSILPMLVILAALAVCWFYYVSSVPLKKAAIVQVEQGKTEISVLSAKIKTLEAEVTRLGVKLGIFEKAAVKAKASAKKGVAVVKKAAPKTVSTPAAVKQDPSFDKAPIPFWQQMKSRGSLIQKSQKNVRPVLETPAVKVDSFSKAPKPFWLKPRVKPAAAKVKKEVKISAPPVIKAAPKVKKTATNQEPAAAPVFDPSFKKAPKPFWIKD